MFIRLGIGWFNFIVLIVIENIRNFTKLTTLEITQPNKILLPQVCELVDSLIVVYPRYELILG